MRDTADLRAKVASLGPWYQRIDFGHGIVTDETPRWQGIEFGIIRPHVRGGFEGKRVLELASNACGLAMLMAQEGAQVTALDPFPLYIAQAHFVRDFFGLEDRITLSTETVYHAHRLGCFDIVVFHGLLYHLRHPQLVLDMLSHLVTEQLFFSCQLTPGNDPILVNRRAQSNKKREGQSGGPLLGWRMTENACTRMAMLAGFQNVRTLSRTPHPGETAELKASNSAYFAADAALVPAPVPFLFEERLGTIV